MENTKNDLPLSDPLSIYLHPSLKGKVFASVVMRLDNFLRDYNLNPEVIYQIPEHPQGQVIVLGLHGIINSPRLIKKLQKFEEVFFFNTEQLQCSWKWVLDDCRKLTDQILEYAPSQVPLWHKRNYQAWYLPLSEHFLGTFQKNFLHLLEKGETKIRGGGSGGTESPHSDQKPDESQGRGDMGGRSPPSVGFIGGKSQRREFILNFLKKVDWATGVYGREFDLFCETHPIQLNLHFYPDGQILEVFRLMELLDRGCTVISERSIDPSLDSLFEPFVTFTDCEDLENLRTMLESLQSEPQLRDSIKFLI